MPGIVIEVRRQYSKEEETNLMNAVHIALQTAFKIPASGKNIRLFVHEPHRFSCPAEVDNPEYYTFIGIEAFAGRSIEAKRKLYKAIVEGLGVLGIPLDHIEVVLREIPRENWGLRGGRAASDVELSFKIV
jgi:phenylpyruvate tautomerase PptA (4-oxalocrotonate tautomerase family)